MSHSTTATTVYDLLKYSRSSAQVNGTANQAEEWQHFSNPTIRLFVDVKKSSVGELESFKTRVVWSLNAGNDTMDVDQREVVFEDLDLLTFSSMNQIQMAQGFPLKAVYRDAVVGFRYLYPRTIPVGTPPTDLSKDVQSYKRFQITFQTVSFATSFINSIKYICPCKATNPVLPGHTINRAATMMQRANAPAPIVSIAPSSRTANSIASHPASVRFSKTSIESLIHPNNAPANEQQSQFSSDSAGAVSVNEQLSSLNDDPARTTGVTPLQISSSGQHPGDTRDLEASSQGTDTSWRAPLSYAPNAPVQSGIHTHGRARAGLPSSDDPNVSRPSSAITASSVLPDCSACTSSQAPVGIPEPVSDSTWSVSTPSRTQSDMGPPPVPPHTTAPAQMSTSQTMGLTPTANVIAPATESFLTSLSDSVYPYNLSRADLESLVARIVREDGFVKLLEDLDSMWKIKGFLRQI
ncbi:uncharacterized protein FIBRA_03992 [Fibroporia radiculosa]|uniref:Uncharacterized protein n=1 Tax=Fibroporia radiculosa TaxID=599839 RepID=J4GNV2_9APHY|nr:uncharacterized protein FIBRA_03992 [Fibroporia radiculosa]CCM01920.1 predicted protein [Fibroporia radiculosa]